MSRLVTLIAAVLVVAGCNTVAGLGKDMEAAGGAVEKADNRGKKN